MCPHVEGANEGHLLFTIWQTVCDIATAGSHDLVDIPSSCEKNYLRCEVHFLNFEFKLTENLIKFDFGRHFIQIIKGRKLFSLSSEGLECKRSELGRVNLAISGP